MKKNVGSDRSMNCVSEIESNIAHSGAGKGMKSNAWGTSQNLSKIDVQTLQPLPLYVMCSNRNLPNVPASFHSGGRIKVICTTVEDKNVGILDVSPTKKKDDKTPVRLGMYDWDDEGAQALREIPDTAYHTHLMFFIARHWMRRLVPFTHRVLASPIMEQEYSFSFSFRRMLVLCDRITSGIRRPYMALRKTFGRSFNGPFRTATAVPIYIQNTVLRSLMQAVQDKKTASGHGNDQRKVIDLHTGFFNCMRSLYSLPIDSHTFLSALYTWISQTVLNPNLMILSCYTSYLFGIKQCCPVLVLAKAVKAPQLMTRREQIQYDEFCSLLLNWILVPKTMQLSQFHEFTRRRKTRLAMERQMFVAGGIKAYTLNSWYSNLTEPSKQDVLHEEDKRRHTGLFSTYLRPSIVFHDNHPDWLEYEKQERSSNHSGHQTNPAGAQDNQDMDTEDNGRYKIIDKYVNASVRTRIAHSFAQQQSEDAEKIRIESFRKSSMNT